MKTTACLAAVTLILFARPVTALEIWGVDPLTKVFPDSQPSGGIIPSADVAAGETATFQVVIRSEQAMSDLQVKALPRPVARGSGPRPGRTGATLPARVRFVGYVPVDKPTQKPDSQQLRKPPADYPDPLLEDTSIDVPAGRAQPIWVTVAVPEDAKPGPYVWMLEIGHDGKKEPGHYGPLQADVAPVRVGRSRLWVTNWFSMHAPHMAIKAEPDSPEYWALMARYARNMAEHRQNMALISPLALAKFTAAANGELAVDFGTFDRWVEVFKEAGVIGRIEGGHFGGRVGGWESQFGMGIRQVQDGKVVAERVDPASPQAEAFYAKFLPALVKHLQAKGWLDIYTQHLGDEPIEMNAGTYKAMAALLRKHAPELKIIEACHYQGLVGAVDVWVPQLNFVHQQFEHYKQRQAAGEEVWFYTCVFPQGDYANRFIEQPLIKTRLLHWINYRYGLTGYLHWGYNFWLPDQDPFKKLTRPHGGPEYLPAGDAWIVYPGKDGPLDSIRFEAMRDGIADYELLSMLAEKDRPAADRLAASMIQDFDRYDTDVTRFRRARRELLRLLAGTSASQPAAPKEAR